MNSKRCFALGACAIESLSSAARAFRVSRGANPQSTAWFPRVSNEGSRGMIRRNARIKTLPTPRFLWRRLLVLLLIAAFAAPMFSQTGRLRVRNASPAVSTLLCDLRYSSSLGNMNYTGAPSTNGLNPFIFPPGLLPGATARFTIAGIYNGPSSIVVVGNQFQGPVLGPPCITRIRCVQITTQTRTNCVTACIPPGPAGPVQLYLDDERPLSPDFPVTPVVLNVVGGLICDPAMPGSTLPGYFVGQAIGANAPYVITAPFTGAVIAQSIALEIETVPLPAGVPTSSEWGLIALVVAIMGMGAFLLVRGGPVT